MRQAQAVSVLVCCLLATNRVVRADDSQRASLPPNLTSVAMLEPALGRMWRASPTFRRQCRRLAEASYLHVNLLLEELPRRPSHRSRGAMTWRDGLLVSVDVHVASFSDPVEAIAHELEHVIEQLDGVDLGAAARTGAVRVREDNAFETERAIEVGRRVAREVGQPAGSPPRSVPPVPSWRPLEVVAQQQAVGSGRDPSTGRVSADGRYVVFVSNVRLSSDDANTLRDIYVFDVSTGLATLETPGADARPANGESFNADISGDGRYVVFESVAGNLTEASMAPGVPRVFWRDRQTGVTRLLSTTPAGGPANGLSTSPAISVDGRMVVFSSSATNLLDDAGIAAGGIGIYRIDLSSNRRTRLDVTPDGRGHAGQSSSPAISRDGRLVAFASDVDLTTSDETAGRDRPRDVNGVFDVYVRDVPGGRTRRVSVSSAGADADGPSYQPAISIDGRWVAFVSEASNLTLSRSRSAAQVFLRDMETGTIELISRTPAGRPGNARSARPAVSGDGLVIAYQSLASNLRCDGRCDARERDINLVWDVYVYDRTTRQTTRASADEGDEWMESSRGPSLNEAGDVLTFSSTHPGWPEDEAHDEDLFIARPTTGSFQSTSNPTVACRGEPGCVSHPAKRPVVPGRKAP